MARDTGRIVRANKNELDEQVKSTGSRSPAPTTQAETSSLQKDTAIANCNEGSNSARCAAKEGPRTGEYAVPYG